MLEILRPHNITVDVRNTGTYLTTLQKLLQILAQTLKKNTASFINIDTDFIPLQHMLEILAQTSQ